MKHKIDIKGALIPNNYKAFYDWMGQDATCVRDVSGILEGIEDGDEVDVYINSPGGVIDVGSEIYSLLRAASETADVKIYITGEACSAASVVACAGYCEMSPTALMMVHCVSTGVQGNHNDLEHTAEVLRTADRAMCKAYTEKTGMTEKDALAMMEHETWLTAEQAKEKGLVDAIMFEEPEQMAMVASSMMFQLPTEEQMALMRKALGEDPEEDADKEALKRAKAKFNLLNLRRM